MNDVQIPNNEELYKERCENYEKIFKRFLKSIPKSILREHLIKYKIIKQDYLTGECEFKDSRSIRNCDPSKEIKE